jgi:hypothetical protein
MHEGGALTWRELVEKHHFALLDELSGRLDSDLREAVARAIEAEHTKTGAQLQRSGDEARRTQAESLNQVLRRLRRSTGDEQVLEILAESCAPFAEHLVVLVFENNRATSVAGFGTESGADINGAFSFDTESAPAIMAAIESRDPVVALATENEISPVLAEALSPKNQTSPDLKAYLFPVVGRHSVLALLVASGVALSAPIELLCEAAGMRIESAALPVVSDRQPDAPGLVQLAPGVPASETSGPRAWDELTLEDQKLHLQAQRVARVRVAEMRLYHERELKSGAALGDIYGALQSEIDSARDQFLQAFLSKSPTMVDYLHLEILRSLAHDDDRLLGHNYPGPMV